MITRSTLLLSLSWLLAGCVFDLDTVPRPCPRGPCTTPDQGPGKDLLPDLPAPDRGPTADGPARDAPKPDKKLPDKAVPDKVVPDKVVPDMVAPDMVAPDTLSPDLVAPKSKHTTVTMSCAGGWCEVPAGCFEMGLKLPGGPANPNVCPPLDQDEERHTVYLTTAFEMMEAEVTQSAYKTVMKAPTYSFGFTCSGCPAESVTWHQAAAYCNRLTPKSKGPCYSCTGSGGSTKCTALFKGSSIYKCPGTRLPTEAEWEYAYRAGSSGIFYNGGIVNSPYCKACSCAYCGKATVGDIAWYTCNSGNKTHKVKSRNANAWGLYDMSGNVAEWTHDHYTKKLGTKVKVNPLTVKTSTLRVVRGGSWADQAEKLRASERGSSYKATNTIGFRCVRPATAP